jgi:hypothetical protein
VDTPRNHEVLRARLKEKLHADITLRFEVSEAAAPVTPKPSKNAHAKTPETADFRNDPLIAKALEVFKGTIVEVRK